MMAVPLTPSDVAVIVATPTATPSTSPLASTVATVGSELAQETARPVRALPPTSCGVATSCTVPATGRFDVDGATVTDATGEATPTCTGTRRCEVVPSPIWPDVF